jgi:ATP-dependent Zn protease
VSEAVDIRDDGDSTIPWREIVAGHEAGHAVVAWHYGAHIDLVSIVPLLRAAARKPAAA